MQDRLHPAAGDLVLPHRLHPLPAARLRQVERDRPQTDDDRHHDVHLEHRHHHRVPGEDSRGGQKKWRWMSFERMLDQIIDITPLTELLFLLLLLLLLLLVLLLLLLFLLLLFRETPIAPTYM